jgi:hypothetical protein
MKRRNFLALPVVLPAAKLVAKSVEPKPSQPLVSKEWPLEVRFWDVSRDVSVAHTLELFVRLPVVDPVLTDRPTWIFRGSRRVYDLDPETIGISRNLLRWRIQRNFKHYLNWLRGDPNRKLEYVSEVQRQMLAAMKLMPTVEFEHPFVVSFDTSP